MDPEYDERIKYDAVANHAGDVMLTSQLRNISTGSKYNTIQYNSATRLGGPVSVLCTYSYGENVIGVYAAQNSYRVIW